MIFCCWKASCKGGGYTRAWIPRSDDHGAHPAVCPPHQHYGNDSNDGLSLYFSYDALFF